MTSDSISIDNSALLEQKSMKNLSYFIKLDKVPNRRFTSLYTSENILHEKIIPAQPYCNQLHEVRLEALNEITHNEEHQSEIKHLQRNMQSENMYEDNAPQGEQPNLGWSKKYPITETTNHIATLTELVGRDKDEKMKNEANNLSNEIDDVLHLNAIEIINKLNIINTENITNTENIKNTENVNILEKISESIMKTKNTENVNILEKISESIMKTKNIESHIGNKNCEETPKNNSSTKRRVLGRSWSTISERNTITCNTPTTSAFSNIMPLKETTVSANEVKRRSLGRSFSTNSQNNSITNNIKLLNSEETIEQRGRSWSTSTERNSISSTTPLMTSETANKHQLPPKRKVLHRSLSSCISRFKQISVFQMRSHQKLFTEDGVSDDEENESDLMIHNESDLVVHNLRKCVSVPESLHEEDLDTTKLFLPRRMAICSEVRTPALKQLKAYLVLTRLKQYNFL